MVFNSNYWQFLMTFFVLCLWYRKHRKLAFWLLNVLKVHRYLVNFWHTIPSRATVVNINYLKKHISINKVIRYTYLNMLQLNWTRATDNGIRDENSLRIKFCEFVRCMTVIESDTTQTSRLQLRYNGRIRHVLWAFYPDRSVYAWPTWYVSTPT